MQFLYKEGYITIYVKKKKKKGGGRKRKKKKETALLLHSPKHCTYSAILLFSKYSVPSDFTFLPDILIFSRTYLPRV